MELLGLLAAAEIRRLHLDRLFGKFVAGPFAVGDAAAGRQLASAVIDEAASLRLRPRCLRSSWWIVPVSHPGGNLARLAGAAFVVLYVGLMLRFAVDLRFLSIVATCLLDHRHEDCATRGPIRSAA